MLQRFQGVLLLFHEPRLISAGAFVAVLLFVWILSKMFQASAARFLLGLGSALVVGVACCLAVTLERRGLATCLPARVLRALQEPLFELLGELIRRLAESLANFLRLGLLIAWELTDEQREEVLHEMDPTFRHYIIEQSLASLLPSPLRRLLMGRAAAAHSCAPRPNEHVGPTLAVPPREAGTWGSSLVRAAVNTASGSGETRPRITRKGSADNLLDIVRNIDSVARSSNPGADSSTIKRIMREKMMGKTAMAAEEFVTNAKAKVVETVDYGKEKVSEVRDGVGQALAHPRTKAAGWNGVVGGTVGGTTGAVGGTVTGSTIGAMVGVVPAVFTLGLSIPACAFVGGLVGGVSGATVLGGTGFCGGAAWGFLRYKAPEVDT